ncbi:MAG: hypothetical protein LWX56_01095 [Ignavibacteria bacterium]|nr:hypothetical protein [Ignavibacteria bacterium]
MTTTLEKRDLVDMLIHKIRLEGYQILNRRFGKYLPDPQPIGNYTFDILAKRNGVFVLGLCLDAVDFTQNDLAAKIEYLATRTSRYSNLPVVLFIGIDQSLYVRLAHILQQLPSDVRQHIRSHPLTDAPLPDLFFHFQREPQAQTYIN